MAGPAPLLPPVLKSAPVSAGAAKEAATLAPNASARPKVPVVAAAGIKQLTPAQAKTALAAYNQYGAPAAAKAQALAAAQARQRALTAPLYQKGSGAGTSYSSVPKTALGESVAQPTSILHELGDVVGTAKAMGEGALETAKAVVHDAVHPVQTAVHPLHSQTFQLAKSTIETDPILGDIEQGSLQPTERNPFQTALDLTGVGSVTGKAAEIGLLGDAAKSAVDEATSRSAVEVPGTNTRLIRPGYSLNPAAHGLQRLADERAAAPLSAGGVDLSWTRYLSNPINAVRHGVEANPQEIKALNQRIDEDWNTSRSSQLSAHEDNAASYSRAKKLVASVPGGSDLVGHFQQLLPDDPAAAKEMMKRNLSLWKDYLDKHDAVKDDATSPDHLPSKAADNLRRNVAAMQNGLDLSETDLQKVIAAAKERKAFQEGVVNPARIDAALNPEEQLERRGVLPYAQQYMGAIHTSKLADKDQILSDAGIKHRDLGRQIQDARGELSDIKDGSHDEIRPLVNAANKTERELQRARGAKDADLVAAKRAERDQARLVLVNKRRELRAQTAAKIRDLSEQRSELSGKQLHLKGWVVPAKHVPTAEALEKSIAEDNPIHGISPLNRDYEPLSVDAALADAKSRGLTPGYLSGSHPEEDAVRRIRGGSQSARGIMGRGGATKPYLGDSFERGTFDGTLEGSAKSAAAGLGAALKANTWDRVLDSAGIVGDDGMLLTFPNTKQGIEEANLYAQRFEEEHPGQPLSIVGRYMDKDGNFGRISEIQGVEQDPEQRLALVHENGLQRLEAHQDAMKSIPVLGTANRLWRAGTLGASANYIQAVPQEGLVRTAFAGINPLRTLPVIGTKLLKPSDLNEFLDRIQAASKDETLDPETRAVYRNNYNLLHGLSHGGTVFGSAAQELRDSMAHLNEGKPSDAVALARKIEKVVYTPGNWVLRNVGKLESIQTRAVLNDWVKHAKVAQGSMDDLVKALGDGKDGANIAATAAHRLNDVLGNYLHRSPTEQRLIRNFTPFVPWLKNAVRFVYITMPRDNPIVSSWLTNVGLANAGAWQQDHKDLASFLSTNFLGVNYGNALETVGGVDPLRNTPFGVGETAPLNEITQFEPSLLGPIFGALGLDSYGQPIPTKTYGKDIQSGSTGALTHGLLKNVLGELPYESAISHAVQAATGHTSKEDELSRNKALAVIENVLGGSLKPLNYGVYSKSSSSSDSTPGFGSFGSLGGLGTGGW